MKYPLLFLTSILLVATACQKHPAQAESAHLGVVKLEVSGSDSAKPYFEEGLLLLHSFEFDDAAEAFRKAREVDSAFAMAYWGEAMTYNHPLWKQQDAEEARKVLIKLGATPEERYAKAGTEFEKDFLRAIDVLYGEGEKAKRDSAYAKTMEEMYQKYPQSHEVAAFYALSLLGSVQEGRDEEVFEKSAAIVEGILKENPQHPGALHYLIHSYDDPYHAAQAQKAADRYSEVAPDASHALHMPSHIFVALGMWDEVIASNEESYAASVARMERKGLDNDARSYHAFYWLMYGYLQKGRVEDAERLLREMIGYTQEKPSRSARSYLTAMKGTFLVETGKWDHELAELFIDQEELDLVDKGITNVTKGLVAYHLGHMNSLKIIIETMESQRREAGLGSQASNIPVCGIPTKTNASQLDRDIVYVMEMELRGLLANSEGDNAAAEEWLSKASKLEQSISYSYGPPVIIYPSFELYGEWLLAHNRPEEALAQFKIALERGPGRAKALKGSAMASGSATGVARAEP